VVEKDEVKITDKLGEILKREQLSRGVSRDEIAERTGIGVRHLAAIENEKRMPSAEVLCRLVRAIGISADCIVYPDSVRFESEDAQLVRLIRTCDKRDRKAVKAMIEALCYSRASDDDQ